MKKLLLILPAILLVACGKFSNQQAPVQDVIADLGQSGHLSDVDQETVENLDLSDESLQDITVTEDIANGDNVMILDLRGQKATVEYMNDPKVAFKINGLEVTHKVARNEKKLDGLLEGLLQIGLDRLNGGLISGLPADLGGLIEAGLEIIQGGNIKESIGQILGVVVRGFLDVFLAQLPFGSLLAPIVDGLVDRILPGDAPVDGTPEDTFADRIIGFIGNLFD